MGLRFVSAHALFKSSGSADVEQAKRYDMIDVDLARFHRLCDADRHEDHADDECQGVSKLADGNGYQRSRGFAAVGG